jgi:hypothetical protein
MHITLGAVDISTARTVPAPLHGCRWRRASLQDFTEQQRRNDAAARIESAVKSRFGDDVEVLSHRLYWSLAGRGSALWGTLDEGEGIAVGSIIRWNPDNSVTVIGSVAL